MAQFSHLSHALCDRSKSTIGAYLHALQTDPNYDPCKAKCNDGLFTGRFSEYPEIDIQYTCSYYILTFNGVRTIRTKLLHPISNFLSCWSRLTCDTTKLQTLLRTEVIQSPQLKISVYGEEISCARLLMGSGFEASNSRGKPSQADSVDFMGSPCCHACQGAKFLRISTHRTRKAQKLNPRGAIDDHLLPVSDAFHGMFKYMSWLHDICVLNKYT